MHQKEAPELLPLLEEEQDTNCWVSEKALKRISKQTGVPVSRVYAVATFYSHIHLKKQGQYVIEICNSPSCYLSGSLTVIELLERRLKIKSGETTDDGKFSLHIGSCIGCCNMPPAMMINKKVYTHLTEDKVLEILKQCKS